MQSDEVSAKGPFALKRLFAVLTSIGSHASVQQQVFLQSKVLVASRTLHSRSLRTASYEGKAHSVADMHDCDMFLNNRFASESAFAE